MNIVELKKSIENRSVEPHFIVFEYTDNNFIAYQYADAISRVLGRPLQYVSSISEMLPVDTLFGELEEEVIRVFSCDSLSEDELNKLKDTSYNIVITKKCEVTADNVIRIPKLERWQIKDYLYTQLTGIEQSCLDFLLEVSSYNIFRLQEELDKLLLFDISERQSMIEQMIQDQAFDDLSSKTVFDISNAITARDTLKLKRDYCEIDNIDVSEMGLISILLKNFRNIIDIQLSKDASPQSLGMKESQFYAVKRNINHYSREELLRIYSFLLSLDKDVKTGNIPTNILIDYIIIHILGV